MAQQHLERITVRSLLVVILLVVGFTLLPFHTAHAATRLPLTGCLNNSHYQGYQFPGLITNIFEDIQFYDCSAGSNYVRDALYFQVNGGSATYVEAQGDTWLTQVPHPGGTRYGETGRSSKVDYPANGVRYYVQTASYSYFAPAWGCNWVNFPQFGFAYDYICANMV